MEENITNLVKMSIKENKDKTKIYESPDNGKTVYWRYFGDDKKHLLYYDPDWKYPWEK